MNKENLEKLEKDLLALYEVICLLNIHKDDNVIEQSFNNLVVVPAKSIAALAENISDHIYEETLSKTAQPCHCGNPQVLHL